MESGFKHTEGPSILVLTRQNVPTYPRHTDNAAELVEKGAYVLSEAENGQAEGIVMATGSEVQLAMQAQADLASKGIHIRVVSMPSWELFDAQPTEYKDSVLPPDLSKRVSIEAGSTFGWQKYFGLEGRAIGIDSFGESAPYEALYDHFNITSDAIVSYFTEQS